MAQVLVTGAGGFLGWHVMCGLDGSPDYSGVPAGREQFADASALEELVRGAAAIVHLAGVNRGTDEDVMTGNVDASTTLVRALEKAGVNPPVVYASSIHIDKDTNYGASKRKAGEILSAWADRAGARYVNLVLPHVFGERGRPFYNSVVSTFCYQLADGQTPRVDQDSELYLLHAQSVADLIMGFLGDTSSGEIRPPGVPVRVSELLGLLRRFDVSYRSECTVPDVNDHIRRDLFNTYRSYLYPKAYPIGLTRNADNRGHLVEVVKSNNGGQMFFSSTKPGITRGNHYHRRKIERFAVIQGTAEIAIRRLFDNTVEQFRVTGDSPVFIDMPTMHTHNITNTGDSELLTLFWANEIFDPEAPDTVAAQV